MAAIRNNSTLMLNEPSRTELDLPANDYNVTARGTSASRIDDCYISNPRIDYKNMRIIDKKRFDVKRDSNLKTTMHGYLHQDS